ncbi:hypothetical protein Desaci_2202 [Desulfosporosinus acidiphilus SJ4]|uniref:Uncharacterized protein n=1 Tax=Desulfosporosinus acidiphilus (strain DSM 22704 / JCM 16185 / SJ4) TaxID=646529 RepID=I4D5T9_DESAJ|nr:hypothetical protein [Desulfosporosinus acidiphilus]AFM41163.1 hypothetical protein Desaci_2202 [Desulfosporosinus acidiphilus SJ4]
MTENKLGCSCKSVKELDSLPILIGGIIVYELAVTVIMLVFILWELEKPSQCQCNSYKSEEEESEPEREVIELSTEE